jgi:hypothetical protein
VNPDRLFNLLPVVHRERDDARGHVLRALLAVIGELDPGEPFAVPPRREA